MDWQMNYLNFGKMKLKNLIKHYLHSIPTEEFALFLSGGMDSHLLLLACLELNKKVHAYTFKRAGVFSSDVMRAAKIAEAFNLEFTIIDLPMHDREYLIYKLKDLKYTFGAKKKTEFECTFPFLLSSPKVMEKHILVGHAADGHYCISKKGMLHWRDKIDEFRSSYFSNPDCCQNKILRKLFEPRQIYFPYMEKPIVDYFMGKSWDECNKPKQKQLTRDCFTTWPIPFENHTNLQLGDSGIAEGFNILLEGTNFKSPISIYNRL